jgi:hypothetical protein
MRYERFLFEAVSGLTFLDEDLQKIGLSRGGGKARLVWPGNNNLKRSLNRTTRGP